MKKLKLFIIGLLLVMPLFIFQTTALAESKKVNVYIFRGEGCPHCEEAIEWFEGTLAEDEEYKDLYELVKYEVWYDESNSELMQAVAEQLGTEASGVPFIVVGDKYFSGFSAQQSPEQIKTAIKEASENSKYQDIVSAVKNGNKIVDTKEKTSILPIIIVSAVAIVVVLGLVFFTKEK